MSKRRLENKKFNMRRLIIPSQRLLIKKLRSLSLQLKLKKNPQKKRLLNNRLIRNLKIKQTLINNNRVTINNIKLLIKSNIIIITDNKNINNMPNNTKLSNSTPLLTKKRKSKRSLSSMKISMLILTKMRTF